MSGLLRVLSLVAALVLSPAAWTLAAPRAVGPGNHDRTLTIGGRTRTFIVHVPSRVDGTGSLPVIVAFHGGGGNGRGFQAYANLDRVADREGAVVVYPDGTGPLARRLLTWNAGGCCGRAQAAGVDDVAFTLALLRELARDVPIDATRVYATGHSNGAMMAYRLAAEASEHVAAIAAVGGMMTLERVDSSRPMPVLHIHSLDDPRALYVGGPGPPFPFTDVRVVHRPVVDGLARWVALDRCAAEPTVGDIRRAAARAGEHTATLLLYQPCAGEAVVAHWRLTGSGHGWPGSRSPLPERIMGPDTTVIDAAEEIWRFVRRFSRHDAPPLR